MTTARKTAAPKTSSAKKVEEVELPKEETSPEVNTFEYKGVTYSVPADPMDLPMEVGLAETEFDLIQEVVGPDQWAEFRKSRPSIRQFGEFSELVLNACGYGDAGN